MVPPAGMKYCEITNRRARPLPQRGTAGQVILNKINKSMKYIIIGVLVAIYIAVTIEVIKSPVLDENMKPIEEDEC